MIELLRLIKLSLEGFFLSSNGASVISLFDIDIGTNGKFGEYFTIKMFA